MILSSTPCEPENLPRLLSGDLPQRDARRMEEHLSSCTVCQRALEQYAGDPHWWQTTETVLKSRSSTVPIADGGPRTLGVSSLHRFPLRDQDVRDGLRNVQQQAERSSQRNPGSLEGLGSTGSRNVQGEHAEDTSRWLRKIAPDGMLGPFRLEASIGHGGTGIVAQAIDTQLNRRVAVKLLYPHLASSGAARQRFAREAQAAAAVVHPSVVPIHAVDAENDPPYLVMTYVPGGSLQQRLDKNGPLELVELLRIALQIAEGLSAAHAQGLVHRDVKPANILLEAGTDRVLLTDFGLARALDDATLTASGYVSGTPPYMSPEQARGDAIDCRSDLFSVGSLIFTMATGRVPFQGNSALSVLREVNDSPTPSVRAINERMPAWLDRLISLMHAKVPGNRIASAEVLAELIRQCLAHVQRPTVFSLPRELSAPKPMPIGLTVACLLLGGLVGLVGGWWFGPSMRWSGKGEQGVRVEHQATSGAILNAGQVLSGITQRDSWDGEEWYLREQAAQLRAELEQLQLKLENQNEKTR